MALVPRFTPAYAGNTFPSFLIGYSLKIHPRIRGEYLLNGVGKGGVCGSPPHTRGIPTEVDGFTSVGRFTPAYAGNTRGHACNNGSSRVHPRIRGEYSRGF